MTRRRCRSGGDLKDSERYQQANKALKANPGIKRVVGHSLGGSVALEMQKQSPKLESRTYGAPVWNPLGGEVNAQRSRNWADPASLFDRSAERSVKWNPFSSFSMTHDFSNIAPKFSSGGDDVAYGWENTDGSSSITQ